MSGFNPFGIPKKTRAIDAALQRIEKNAMTTMALITALGQEDIEITDDVLEQNMAACFDTINAGNELRRLLYVRRITESEEKDGK